MENPTFRLEGLIKSKDSFEDFEGPLTLILQLLTRDKIEIKDVKISVILEQYLDYLDRMKQMDLEIASEFIVMASHLAYIKAKEVLRSGEEEISELDALISSLEELKNRDNYTKLKQVIPFFEEHAGFGALIFVKPPEVLKKDGEYRYYHRARELKAALISLLGRDTEVKITAENVIIPSRLAYPVSEKSEEVLMLLREEGTLYINALFLKSESKTELVATFMAVLELCKSGSVIILEDGDEISIMLNHERVTETSYEY